MFRVSIRELLLLTLAVGCGVAWWLDHRQLGRLRQRCDQLTGVAKSATESLRELGVNAQFKDDNIYVSGSHWLPESAPWNR